MKKFKRIIQILKKAIAVLSCVALFFGALVAISTRFTIPGEIKVYSVLTGSMEPTLPVGSLIITKIPRQSTEIHKDQIITFEQPGFENKFVTHRVHEVIKQGETRFFTTKGDANKTPDTWLISYGRVKGIYQRHIPYLGYFLQFLRSPFGIALFILLPVSILVIGELKNIGSILLEMKLQKEKSLLKGQKEAKKVKKKKPSKEILIIILFAFSLFSIPQTFALFATEPVEISSISITTGSWVNPDAPVINNVNVLVATPEEANSPLATISWDTDEPATTNLEWRTVTTDPWNTIIPIDITADQTSHSIDISNLQSDKRYYYKIITTDQDGNTSSLEGSFDVDGTRSGLPSWANIVINEYLPNPTGEDNAPKPGGEWVELYNREATTMNLTGWYLTDFNSSHRLYLTATNTTSSNPATAGLNIAPGEFLVVYRDGDLDFDLNNGVLGDIVILHRPSGLVVDFHSYSVILGDEVLENKSFARFPDGSNTWFDPIPSPGGPNILEPVIELNQAGNKQTISFKVLNIDKFINISYELTYETDNEPQGIIGEQELDNLPEFVKDNLTLGTCSTGGTCVYHSGVKNIKLTVILTDKEGKETELEKTI